MSLFAQFRRLLPTFFLVYGCGLAIILVVVLARLLGDVPVSLMTRDPLAVAESQLRELRQDPDAAVERIESTQIQFYYGFLSNVGVLLWCANAAICLFSAVILREGARGEAPAGFFLWGGIITLVLLLDDLFMLHERAFPRYFHLNERILFAGYASCVLVFLLKYRVTILNTDYLFLVFAFVLFGLSLLTDHIDVWIPRRHLLEDGAKFAGILSWSAYFVRTCLVNVRAATQPGCG